MVGLSPRETEVLQHIVRGLTDKQAAREMSIAPSSVKTLVRSIFNKTGCVRKRVGLVYVYQELLTKRVVK